MPREVATSMDGVHCLILACLYQFDVALEREREISLHNVLSLTLGSITCLPSFDIYIPFDMQMLSLGWLGYSPKAYILLPMQCNFNSPKTAFCLPKWAPSEDIR